MSIKLLETDRQIEAKINKAILEEVNKVMSKAAPNLKNRVKLSVDTWILEQPEIDSLRAEGVRGSLNAQFGLAPGQGVSAIQQIVDAINETVTVEFEPINKKFQGGLTFNIQPERFRNLLGLPVGFTIREDGPLHWMDWLLIQGNRTIVYGYSYKPSFNGISGGGTMVEGGVWRVPPQFAGDESDNFITRALDKRDREIAAIFRDVLR